MLIRISRWKIVAGVMAAISLVLILAGISSVVTIVAAVLAIVATLIWHLAEREARAEEMIQLLREKDQEMMRALSHYRHDWMNDLQVLFGYVSLKKYDKLAPYLERIKSKLGEESHIANVGNASLSLLLMSYRLYSQNFELHVSLHKSVSLNTIPVRPDRLVRIVREVLDLFQQSAEPSTSVDVPNILELTIVTTDDYVEFIYQYTGELDGHIDQSLRQWTEALIQKHGIHGEYVMDDEQVDVVVRIAYV